MPSCTHIGARRPSLVLSGRSRKWSTGARKLPPRIVERSSSTRAYIYTCACMCRSDSNPLDRRNLRPVATRRRRRRQRRRVALLPLLCPYITSHLFLIGEENCGTHIRTFLRARPPSARNAIMDVRRVITWQLAASNYVTHGLSLMRDNSDNFN